MLGAPQDRTGQGRAGQDRAGQDRTGRGRAGQGRTVQKGEKNLFFFWNSREIYRSNV